MGVSEQAPQSELQFRCVTHPPGELSQPPCWALEGLGVVPGGDGLHEVVTK